MDTKSISSLAFKALLLSAALASGAAMAQDATVPGHPRVNEVNQRLENQQERIQKGVANGTINAKQEARDEQHLSNIEQHESADEAKNGGHLTKQEQRKLNKGLNNDGKKIHEQRTN